MRCSMKPLLCRSGSCRSSRSARALATERSGSAAPCPENCPAPRRAGATVAASECDPTRQRCAPGGSAGALLRLSYCPERETPRRIAWRSTPRTAPLACQACVRSWAACPMPPQNTCGNAPSNPGARGRVSAPPERRRTFIQRNPANGLCLDLGQFRPEVFFYGH